MSIKLFNCLNDCSDAELGGETVFPFLEPLPAHLDSCSAEYDPNYFSSGEIEHTPNRPSTLESLTAEFEQRVSASAMEESLSFLREEVDSQRDWDQIYPPDSWQRETIAMSRYGVAVIVFLLNSVAL